MSTSAKLLAAMRRNPKDWRIKQLKTVAKHLDIEFRNDGGSHHVFSHPDIKEILSVPARRPIKPVYIRAFTAFCDRVKEIEK